jgi:hypothetical protein
MGEDGGRNRLVPSLIVGEPQPTSGQLFSKNAILLTKVVLPPDL